MNWDKYRRNGMNRSCTIDLCKAFDDIYPTAGVTRRTIAHARLLECERLQKIYSRQVAASILSGVAYTLGLGLIETVRAVLSAVKNGASPVAVVINNNQVGAQHIVETAAGVTLDIGTVLYRSPEPEEYISSYENALDQFAKALEDAINGSGPIGDTEPAIIKVYADRLRAAEAARPEVGAQVNGEELFRTVAEKYRDYPLAVRAVEECKARLLDAALPSPEDRLGDGETDMLARMDALEAANRISAPSTVEPTGPSPEYVRDAVRVVSEWLTVCDDRTITPPNTMIAVLANHASRSVPSAIEPREIARWNLVRLWFTRQDPNLYIPGIHQARTAEAINEAVDRALAKRALSDGGGA